MDGAQASLATGFGIPRVELALEFVSSAATCLSTWPKGHPTRSHHVLLPGNLIIEGPATCLKKKHFPRILLIILYLGVLPYLHTTTSTYK